MGNCGSAQNESDFGPPISPISSDIGQNSQNSQYSQDNDTQVFHYPEYCDKAKRCYTSNDIVADKNELEKYNCSICLDIVFDPYVNTKCGHLFCRDCISQWQARGKSSCPNCIGKLDCHPCPWIQNTIIPNFVYLCNNCKESFNIGKAYRNILEHQLKCIYEEIKCNCGHYMPKLALQSHQEICQEAKIKCSKCPQYYKRKDMLAHQQSNLGDKYCTNHKLCRKGCGTIIYLDTIPEALTSRQLNLDMIKEHACPLIQCDICNQDILEHKFIIHYDSIACNKVKLERMAQQSSNLPHSNSNQHKNCQMNNKCCSCNDKRPHNKSLYFKYADGRGMANGTRTQFYCPNCR